MHVWTALPVTNAQEENSLEYKCANQVITQHQQERINLQVTARSVRLAITALNKMPCQLPAQMAGGLISA